MKNIIIKHCNRLDYLDRLWNPSSLEILEMLERHYYLYLHNQTMEETEKSLPALCFCELMLQRKKRGKNTKSHHTTKNHKQVKNNQPKKNPQKNPKTKHHKTHAAENQFAF